jgi:hypothetical protein
LDRKCHQLMDALNGWQKHPFQVRKSEQPRVYEAEWIVSISSSPAQRRWVVIEENVLTVYKSFKDRSGGFSLELSHKTRVQPALHSQVGFCIFAFDPFLQIPMYIMLEATGSNTAPKELWIARLRNACRLGMFKYSSK